MRTYSQGQQDTILATIFDKIGTTNKFCVEFGFNSDVLTGGTGSNTARLILEEGWTGLLLDQGHANPAINLCKVLLTPENLPQVFAQHDVPMEPDYVSIDVDSIDLWLFKSLLEAGYRPRVVSVEYNSNYGLEDAVTARLGTTWMYDQCYGASLKALYTVAQTFQYNLVDVAPTMDAFFVRGDLSAAIPLENFRQFTKIPLHAVPSPDRVRATMMEYR